MNRNTTIVLVLVFAVVAVYVLVVQLPKDKAATAEGTGTAVVTTYLWTVTADNVTGLRVVDHVRSLEFALAKDAGGAWTITAPAPQLPDQAAVGRAIGGLGLLTVDSTITSTTDLSVFGVLSPTHTIEVTLADGTHLKASIGDKTPTGSDYYVLRDGAANVVTVGTFAIDALTGLIDKPPVPAPTATASAGPGTIVPLVTEAGSGTPPVSATAGAAAATGTGSAAPPTPTAASLATATATAGVATTATATP